MKRCNNHRAIAALLAIAIFLSLCGCVSPEPIEPTEPTQPTVEPTVPTSPLEPTESVDPTNPTEPEWNGVIDASFFTSKVSDFNGEVDEQAFTGVLFADNQQQPKIYMNEKAISSIRSYAKKNGFDALRITVYVSQDNGAFTADGIVAANNQWTTIELPLRNLNLKTVFQSTSTGKTAVYMQFEFAHLPPINISSFTSSEITAYSGTVEGVAFNGFVFKSTEYQPLAGLNAQAIEALKEYAALNGFNALRVHAFPMQKNNSFVIGGKYYSNQTWGSADFSIADIGDYFQFWSQSEGATQNYMYFEFVNSENPFVPTESKPGSVPKPTEPTEPPVETEPVATEPVGPTEPIEIGVVHAGSFTGGGFTFTDVKTTVGDVSFTGVYATSTDYQPRFGLTAEAVAAIKEAAAAAGKTHIAFHSYTDTKDNGVYVFNSGGINKYWMVCYVEVAKLDEYVFSASIANANTIKSNSQGYTNMYIWTEFVDEPGVVAPNFTYDTFNRYNFGGVAGERNFNGIMFVSKGGYQPAFALQQAGVDSIKAYAEKNGYDTLTIHAYFYQLDNGGIINGKHFANKAWGSVDIPVSELSTSTQFKSNSQGWATVWMYFEFSATEYVGSDVLDAGSWTGGNFKIEDVQTTIEDVAFTGIHATSSTARDRFGLTADAVASLKEAAKAAGKTHIAFHSYTTTLDNGIYVFWSGGFNSDWMVCYVAVDDLDKYVFTSSIIDNYTVKSNSQGWTDIYMWVEFVDEPSVTAGYFNYNQIKRNNFGGVAGGRLFNGIVFDQVQTYQPSITLQQTGVDSIKAYATKNGYTTIKIYIYAEQKDNNIVVGDMNIANGTWAEIELPVDALSTSLAIKCNGTASNKVWMYFEFE